MRSRVLTLVSLVVVFLGLGMAVSEAVPVALAQQPIVTWTTTPSLHHLVTEAQQAICKLYKFIPYIAMIVFFVTIGMYALLRTLALMVRLEVPRGFGMMDPASLLFVGFVTIIIVLLGPFIISKIAAFFGIHVNWSVCFQSS